MTQLSTDWRHIAPFALSFVGLPLLWLGAVQGGWWIALAPAFGWYFIPVLDRIYGRNRTNIDPDADRASLFWYRMITLVWFPLQAILIFGTIWYATRAAHLSPGEKIALFAGVGVLSGSIGIVFAHELMHQSPRLDRWLADLLLATVLYSHFRSEHLLVHHPYVGTPRDAVSARYGEGFWKFLARVVPSSFRSALAVEADRLRKIGKDPWSRSNPFWRYAFLQYGAMFLAGLVGGIEGLALFAFQAVVAVFQLELINYIEHYGLTRRKGPDGRYEPAQPRHSWNADDQASNWYLLNLQRHSDHHFKPARPFPLLQTYGPDEAPFLPADYQVMTILALFPPVFRKVMNPRVRAWRQLHYPDVTDW